MTLASLRFLHPNDHHSFDRIDDPLSSRIETFREFNIPVPHPLLPAAHAILLSRDEHHYPMAMLLIFMVIELSDIIFLIMRQTHLLESSG